MSSPAITATHQGSRVNKRSTVFVLTAAARRCGYGPVFVEESLGASLLFRMPRVALDASKATALNEAMRVLISEKLPVVSCR